MARGKIKSLASPLKLVSLPVRKMIDYNVDVIDEDSKGLAKQPTDDCKGALVRVIVKHKRGQESLATQVANQAVQYLESLGAEFVRRPEFQLDKGEVAQSRQVADDGKQASLGKPSDLFNEYAKANQPPENVGQAGIDLVLEVLAEQGDAAKAQARLGLTRFNRITIKDFLAFGGKSEILLEPGVYGVSGRYVGETGTSNRAGKSALLDAVEVALFGECSRGFKGNKSFVHDGADDALVEVGCTLRNGDEFTAGRNIKGSKMRAFATGMDGDLNEDADRAVENALGLGHDDLMRVCFVRQGDLLGLLGAKNASFKDDISRWLGLDVWEKVADEIRNRLRSVEATLKSKRELLIDAQREQKIDAPKLELVESLRVEVNELANKIAEDKQRTNLIRTLGQSIEDREHELQQATKIDAGTLRANLAKMERQERDAKEAETLVREHVLKCKAAVGDGPKGKFSGACPIDGCECPRTTEINKDVVRRRAAVEAVTEAEIDLKQATGLVAESGRQVNSARRALADADAQAKRLPALNAELSRLRLDYQRATADGLLDSNAGSRLETMRRELQAKNDAMVRREQAETRAVKLLGETDDLAGRVDCLKWAARAAGREGVVGMAMRESLVRIEALANEVLEGMGAAHRLSFEEDGQGRLGVVVIDQSGRRPLAADSGGGKAVLALAVRVALSRMLGAKTLFLDEVCESLDPAALGELGDMLRALPSLGIEQVFVISHRAEIADTMERKIVVERDRMRGESKVFEE